MHGKAVTSRMRRTGVDIIGITLTVSAARPNNLVFFGQTLSGLAAVAQQSGARAPALKAARLHLSMFVGQSKSLEGYEVSLPRRQKDFKLYSETGLRPFLWARSGEMPTGACPSEPPQRVIRHLRGRSFQSS